MSTTTLTWEHRAPVLALRDGDRVTPLPPSIAHLLVTDGGSALTDDPAVDLVRLEQDLRRYVRHLECKTADSVEEVAHARDEVTLADAECSVLRRHHQRSAADRLATAATEHSHWAGRETTARSWITTLRQFVIDTEVTHGLLAEAAAGWRRSPTVPASVAVFDTTQAFLNADPRRGTGSEWGLSVPASLDFGSRWRRDGDDDAPDAGPLPRSGPWQVSYLPSTGEIIALRPTLTAGALWLLGSGYDDREATTSLLLDLQSHMREPNSLILAAGRIAHDI